MSDFQINDYLLTQECESIANEIFEEYQNEDGKSFDPESRREDMSDRAWETVDGHEWVIYHYKAARLCVECNTDEGEAFLEDVGMPDTPTFWSLASSIAFGEMRARVESTLSDLIEAFEPEDSDNDESGDA